MGRVLEDDLQSSLEMFAREHAVVLAVARTVVIACVVLILFLQRPQDIIMKYTLSKVQM